MKNVNMQELNQHEIYVTNRDIYAHTRDGETLIPKGKKIKFLGFGYQEHPLFQFEHRNETIVKHIPLIFLSVESKSSVVHQSIVTLKRGIVLNTHDIPLNFEKGSQFEVDAIFYIEDKKKAFITYLSDGGRTSVSGVVDIDDIDKII